MDGAFFGQKLTKTNSYTPVLTYLRRKFRKNVASELDVKYQSILMVFHFSASLPFHIIVEIYLVIQPTPFQLNASK